MQTESFEVQFEQEGERLDKFLSTIYPDFSRAFFQKLIKNQKVWVNDQNQKASFPVHTDDLVKIEIPDAVETTIVPEDIPLDILYEDQDLLIVNKPKGMVVHPSAGHYTGTLVNAIMYHCKDSLSGINGEIRPGIVHRIDMDTTGSLIVCKNDEAHVDIAQQIKEHSVNRIYVGIVCGNVKDDEGTIEGPIGRHPIERKKTENQLLRITKCLNALEIIRICNLNLKRDVHIKYVCIWQVSGILCLVMPCIQVIDQPLKICKDRHYTHKQSVLYIQKLVNTWSFQLLCQNISKNYYQYCNLSDNCCIIYTNIKQKFIHHITHEYI